MGSYLLEGVFDGFGFHPTFLTFVICIDNYITGSFFRRLQMETMQADMFSAENARF